MSKSDNPPASSSMIVADAYTAVDLDRTILKSTALFYDYIIPSLSEVYDFGESVTDLVAQKERASRGRAFDFIAYTDGLAHKYGFSPITAEQIALTIVDRQRNSDGQIKNSFIDAILVDGALMLIQKLSSRTNEQWGIMTSGGIETQTLKSKILAVITKEKLDLTFPIQIVPTEHKAQTIADEWHDADSGRFLVPIELISDKRLSVRTVRVIDDKQQNLMLEPDTPQQVKDRIETYLVQTAEGTEKNGLSLREVLQEIQRPSER